MDRVNQAEVYFYGRYCGKITKTGKDYCFQYDADYLQQPDASPLSFSLPLQFAEFKSERLFPFFAGLVSEGWLLQQQSRIQKIDPADLLTLLACNGEDLTGAVTLKSGAGK